MRYTDCAGNGFIRSADERCSPLQRGGTERADVVIGPYGGKTDCHLVEAQDTLLYFPQAENTACILASPLPTKAVRLCGDPVKVAPRKDMRFSIPSAQRRAGARPRRPRSRKILHGGGKPPPYRRGEYRSSAGGCGQPPLQFLMEIFDKGNNCPLCTLHSSFCIEKIPSVKTEEIFYQYIRKKMNQISM